MHRFLTTTGLALAMTLGGAAMAQQPSLTVQQQFEAADKASASGDNAAALAAWTTLEARVRNNPRSLAIVRIRKSAVLLALDRKDEAAAAARAGLASLPASDASLIDDRFQAQLTSAASPMPPSITRPLPKHIAPRKALRSRRRTSWWRGWASPKRTPSSIRRPRPRRSTGSMRCWPPPRAMPGSVAGWR